MTNLNWQTVIFEGKTENANLLKSSFGLFPTL